MNNGIPIQLLSRNFSFYVIMWLLKKWFIHLEHNVGYGIKPKNKSYGRFKN